MAPAKTEIWLQDWVERDDQVTIGAAIERSGLPQRHLWYRVPTALRSSVTHSADPFVAGVLFDTMLVGGRLVVHGDVSPSLLRNLEELQLAWEKWRPETYRRVEIVADKQVEAQAADTTAAVMPFSGGVDSCFTAWRHSANIAGPQQCDLRAGMIVHGFDIPVARESEYDGAAKRAEKMLKSIDMDCIRLTTNFRELNGDWEDTHGAGLASCLMLLQKGYRLGLIASSFAYSYLVLPYGSNPLTDGMFTSAAFPVIHDGAGFHRMEKTQAVAQWPAVAEHLRVCWQGSQLDRNCCRCQKCISNMLYFRLVGLPSMECFPQDISDDEISRMVYSREDEIGSMERILKVADELGVTDSWVQAVKTSLRQSRLKMKVPWRVRALWRAVRGTKRRSN